ncbi:Protein of unknown function (DUF3608) domain containing protein [Elaphomyces granulatus]
MSTRGTSKGAHLASMDISSSNTSQCENSDFNDRANKTGLSRHLCTLWVHDENFSREDILFNTAAFSKTGVKIDDVIEIIPVRASGDSLNSPEFGSRSGHDNNLEANTNLHPGRASKFSSRTQGRCLFVVKPLPQDIKQRNPKLEISVTNNLANIFGFKTRMQVLLSSICRSQCSASHVDISFRDQYLVRSDMWRFVTSELVDKTIYKGQKILFMGSIKATVKNIFIRGKKVLSGYFAPGTIPVFRSESVKYVLFIQMSREMWDFDSEGTGDILFSRVINGFLPELFKRWANIDAKHLVTVVLFTRVEYDLVADLSSSPLNVETFRRSLNTDHERTRDFYRVVVNDMASGHWTTILDELKKNFRTFLRDVSVRTAQNSNQYTAMNQAGRYPETPAQVATIAGCPSSAIRGNILEAIHLATSHLASDHIDRDMARTGNSIVVITPGTGLFEVSYESLVSTTDALTNYGIAIDLVCLSPIPLHSVPLFRYLKSRERSAFSVFGEPNNSYSSTDHRQSTASFPSTISHLSPSISELNSFSHMEERLVSSKEWTYGIPHWLDISFWNPETYREGRRIAKNDINFPIPFTVTKKSKAFVPRVKMYEIQMMGIMESEQSNISIPYLMESSHNLHRSQTALVSNHGILGTHSGKPLFSQNPTPAAQLGDSLRPEPFLSSFRNSKEMILAAPYKRQRKMLSWMDDYDDKIFRPFPKRHDLQKGTKAKRPSESDIRVSRFQDRLSTKSITTLRQHEDYITGRNSERRPNQRNIDPPVSPMRSSSKDMPPRRSAIRTAPIGRMSRISRKISFALRGLGTDPPRAQASTEVKAEHASALPILDRKTSSGILIDSENIKLPSSSGVNSVSTPTASSKQTIMPSTPKGSSEYPELPQSRPISIKPRKLLDDSPTERLGVGNSFSTGTTEVPFDQDIYSGTRGPLPTKKLGPKFCMNAGSHGASTSHETNVALAPWVRSINPSNTPKASLRDVSWFGRWQHAYPRPPHVAVVKWKSLKSPAVLPLTTEEFPSSHELAADYLQAPYRVSPNDDPEIAEAPKTRDAVLREMIGLRLSHGFQIVVGSTVAAASGQYGLDLNLFDHRGLGRDGAIIFLSMANTIHRLVCITGGEIEVTKFTRRPPTPSPPNKRESSSNYVPGIRTILGEDYELLNIQLKSSSQEYNWNYADNYIAGHRDHLTNPTSQLRFWMVRYVLIPMRLPGNSRLNMQSFNEDNEEEIHLLGIKSLTHMWQKHKYALPEDRRFQSITRKNKDENPLNIIYQTRNPSEIVAAELDRILLTDPGLDNPPALLLPDSELLQRSDINLSSLAQVIQGDKGIRMMDRRWHWRVHCNCFIGSEFTTWILQNFRDIDTRDGAVDFGNELMKHGLFQHVQQRHNFRDGNYFYQIASEYRITRPESRMGWFPARKADKSIPSTPVWESKDLLIGDQVKPDNVDEALASTPSKSKSKVAILLSKSMKYDVDPRKRSNRPEVVDLHYDRLHNPDSCFHIELAWMGTTPKLIEDAVVSWASNAEKFGLKLVQVPIAEASTITKGQPFRKPYLVKLKVEPPKAPVLLPFNATSFSQQSKPEQHYFQKAILKKFDFVLDFEADSAFPADVEVSYSWSKPEYRYPQYIHQSGCLIAQVTNEGDFLFLANRLLGTKGLTKFERGERTDHYRPRAATYDQMHSPLISAEAAAFNAHILNAPQSMSIDSANLYRSPEILKDQIEEFCSDAPRLEQFYTETKARIGSAKVGPTSIPSAMESSIPSLELPESLVDHRLSLSQALGGSEHSSSTEIVLSSIDEMVLEQEESKSHHSAKSSPQFNIREN